MTRFVFLKTIFLTLAVSFWVCIPFRTLLLADEIPSKSSEVTTGTEEKTGASNSQTLLEKFSAGYLDYFSADSFFTSYFVKGDRGRFRQDNFVDDRASGGIQNMTLRGGKDDVTYEYEGHELINYDYLSRLHVSKKDGFFFNAEGKFIRKYWDGSHDVWDPTRFALDETFQDWPDHHLYTDRGNADVEFGFPISDDAKLIVGYELWARKGKMPTLRGERAQLNNVAIRSIPMRTRVDGFSHAFSARMPFTVNQIHNIEPLLSFEFYRDSQYTDSARYNNGTILQRRDYIDKPEFYDLKVQVKHESFLSDNVYVHSGYFFNFLDNESVRSEVRPIDANPNTYVNPDVDNWRISNVVSFGGALLDFLKQKGLDVRGGFRGEHAYTNTEGTFFAGGNNRRNSDTSLQEGWFGEALSVTYRGLPRTTAYMGLDMEQRRLQWHEAFDARSQEGVTDFGSTDLFPEYKTNITYIDFVPRFKLTHRLNSYLKAYASYKWQARNRQYNSLDDSSAAFYPGVLGDQERRVHEVTTNLDVRLPEAWSSQFKYQLVMDNIQYEKVGDQDQQDLDRDRFSVSLSGPLLQKLFAFISFMYDYYRVDTPTNGPGTNRWAKGGSAYDFNGDVFIIATNLNYQLAKNVSTFLSYQITSSVGDNDNVLNEFGTGFRYKLAETTSLEARYQFFHFNDQRAIDAGYDDDYRGQGISFALKQALG